MLMKNNMKNLFCFWSVKAIMNFYFLCLIKFLNGIGVDVYKRIKKIPILKYMESIVGMYKYFEDKLSIMLIQLVLQLRSSGRKIVLNIAKQFIAKMISNANTDLEKKNVG